MLESPIKLSQLTLAIQGVIESSFSQQSYWVIAEVTNHNPYPSKGHHYFDLVEKAVNSSQILAKMQAVAWSAGNASIQSFEAITGQRFTNDIQVLVRVSVDYHPSFGLKLVLLEIDSNYTIGALEQQKQMTLKALIDKHPEHIQKDGDRFVTSNGKLQLPKVIQRIAVVSSSSSAGLHDFMHTLEANSFGYNVHVDSYFTVVQGELRADIFYNKLLEVFYSGQKYDAVVIIRGGGSQTDFLLFDQYQLGLIVARFPIPIITGIGHQKNETVVDLMAHTALKTPTKAGEFIIAHNRNFEERIIQMQQMIIIKAQQLMNRSAADLANLQATIIENAKQIIVSRKDRISDRYHAITSLARQFIFIRRSELQNAVTSLKLFQQQLIKSEESSLAHFSAMINLMSPVNILRKGFSLVKVDGKVVSNFDKVNVGDQIEVINEKMSLLVSVNDKNNYDGKDFNV